MPREQVLELFKAMDIFALFTREDIWGLVVNEAMAYGLPVVSTNRCNAALELIRKGENGLLVNVENLQQMENALLDLVEDEALRDRMGKQALRTIGEYTIENMAREHIAIFSEHIA